MSGAAGRPATYRLIVAPHPHYGRAAGTLATGANTWRFRVRVKLPRGTYTIRSRAVDSAANIEKRSRKRGSRRNFITVNVR